MGNAVATGGCDGCKGPGRIFVREVDGRIVAGMETLDGRHQLVTELDDEQANRLQLGLHQARQAKLNAQTRSMREPQGPSDRPRDVPP